MIGVAACRSSKKIETTQHESSHQDQKPLTDPSGRLLLFPGKISITDAGGKTTFCIHEKQGMKLLDERLYRPGYVKWSGAVTLEYLDMPGVINKGQSESDFIKIVQYKTPEKL